MGMVRQQAEHGRCAALVRRRLAARMNPTKMMPARDRRHSGVLLMRLIWTALTQDPGPGDLPRLFKKASTTMTAAT